MLSPSTASIESERFVIVGTIKKVGFLQGFTGGRDGRGCVLGMEHLVIVGSKKVGFLQGFTGGRDRKGCVL